MFESDPKKDLERFFKGESGKGLDGWGVGKVRRYSGETDEKYRVRLVEFHLQIGSKPEGRFLEVPEEYRPPFNFKEAEKGRKKILLFLLGAFVVNIGIFAWIASQMDILSNKPLLGMMIFWLLGTLYGFWLFGVSLKKRSRRMVEEQEAKALGLKWLHKQ